MDHKPVWSGHGVISVVLESLSKPLLPTDPSLLLASEILLLVDKASSPTVGTQAQYKAGTYYFTLRCKWLVAEPFLTTGSDWRQAPCEGRRCQGGRRQGGVG